MTARRLGIVVAISAWCLQALVAGQASRSAEVLFADALSKEKAVRSALSGPLGEDAILKALRTVVTDYQDLVRQFPESDEADDALWNAASLSRDAFTRYGEAEDQFVAAGLLRALESAYPQSPLVKKPLPALAAGPAPRSTPAPSTPAPRAPVPSTPASRPPASRPPAAAPARSSTPGLVTVSAIERAVFSDAVRVTIALSGEVVFKEERLSNPDRYYVDLTGVQLGSSLSDGTLRFDGDRHPVRQIRIGRHPGNVLRVVLEAAGIATCGAYPMYSPSRLVLECIPEGVKPPALAHAIPTAPLRAETIPPEPAPALPPPPPPPPPLPIVARRVDAGWGRVLPINRPGDATLSEAMAQAAAAITPVTATPAARNIAGGFSLARQLGLGVSRIVIDPGHGGQDPGARANDTTEADVVLDIALRLEKLFEEVPGVEVILTRRADVFVPLEERTAIANRAHADLFLSIHVNGSSNRQAGGVETYFLNFATSQDAAAVAARENASSGQSMAALPDVVKAMTLTNKRAESRDLATLVQRELLANIRPANRAVKDLGVKQAPFVVLIGAEMPSVLAEVSFLTNTQEGRLLKTTNYRQRVAKGLFDAVRQYQTSLKGDDAVALQ